ncbi:MAG: DASS family sodium-coupled anion symporter [Gemmatimonadetes bacterium]|nr:DASS family sodium-coupled anion symporter [Gemmatimonadota bacterium]
MTERRAWLGLGAAIGLGALLLALPTPAGLSPEGHRMGALFAFATVLWATEAFPVAVTALLALALQPLLGVAPLGVAFQTFISPVFFFVIAMFAIAQAFVSSGLDRRFALWLLAHAGTDSRRVLAAFMIGTATISTIVSDVPCTAIFMAMALGLFERMGIRPGESNFAKSVMIGIPIAAFIGGVGTPAGSAINVLGLGLLEQQAKVAVSFLAWMAIGIPMVVALLPVAWWALVTVYPSERPTIGAVEAVGAERAALGPLGRAEIRTMAIVGTMVALWVASTWIRQLDVVLVSVLGAAALFFPGMGIFTWATVQRSTGWDVLLVIGGVTSLGAASAKTGLAAWLVDAALGGAAGMAPIWLLAAISVFTILVHLVVTIGPVIVAVVVPPMIVLAERAGVNPALYALPVIFSASCAFLLPLDAVTLVTYSRGYYRMHEMWRPGLVVSAAWVVVMTALLMLLGPGLGWFTR